MRKLLMAALTAAALAPAPAAAGDWYLHSGNSPCYVPDECSLMTAGLIDSGEYLIAYSRPRRGLERIGIGPAKPLVVGKIIGDWFYGTAERYTRVGNLLCSIKYAVSGKFVPSGTFVLYGPAPIFARYGCAAVGLDPTGSQSWLRFNFIGSGQPPAGVSF